MDVLSLLAETTDHFSYEPLRSRQAAVASLVAAAVEVTGSDAELGSYIRRLIAAYNAAKAADVAGYFASQVSD